MIDIEVRLGQVWNPEIRPMVREAYKSYSVGAARACIMLAWSAVMADLIEKMRHLAEDGEGQAKALVKDIETAQATPEDPSSIKTMQAVEHAVLDVARELELIDFVEQRELKRLRDDRNLCAHPSLRPLGELFTPTTEAARAHLVSALESLLTNPPLQGKGVVKRFIAHVSDEQFTVTPAFLADAFFRRAKTAGRREIIRLSAKHALLEIELPDDHPVTAEEMADRLGDCLHVFAECDAAIVKESIAKAAEGLGALPSVKRDRAAVRLGGLATFWEALDESTLQVYRDRIKSLVSWTSIVNGLPAQVLALVSEPAARSAIPDLIGEFADLGPEDKATVIALRPGPYFAPFLSDLFKSARSFRGADSMAFPALRCAEHLNIAELGSLLTAWADNDECRLSYNMPPFAVALHEATAHLQPHSQPLWQAFVDVVQSKAEEDSFYRYEELADLVTRPAKA